MISAKVVAFLEHDKIIEAIRYRVFTLEQKVDPAIDFDGLDEAAAHVLVFYGEQPVGTGRILTDGHAGRIAVLAEYRGLGLGAEIVNTLIGHARATGMDRVFLGAQVPAVPFYEKLGFIPCGENYMEANIMHTPMELHLD